MGESTNWDEWVRECGLSDTAIKVGVLTGELPAEALKARIRQLEEELDRSRDPEGSP